MKIGDWVRVTTRSVHCNPHINNVGEVGVVQEINDRCAQIKTSTGGMGTVDRDCLISHTPTPGQEARYLGWHGELPHIEDLTLYPDELDDIEAHLPSREQVEAMDAWTVEKAHVSVALLKIRRIEEELIGIKEELEKLL